MLRDPRKTQGFMSAKDVSGYPVFKIPCNLQTDADGLPIYEPRKPNSLTKTTSNACACVLVSKRAVLYFEKPRTGNASESGPS